MQRSVFVGPVQMTFECFGSDRFRFFMEDEMSMCNEALCSTQFRLSFCLGSVLENPSEARWHKNRTHIWGETDDAYYLYSGNAFEVVEDFVDPNVLWRCKIEKDFSGCLIVPPKDVPSEFSDTLIFSRVFSGFTVNKPLFFCHCCAAIVGNIGVLFLGASGAGKTTLAAILSETGITVLTDDRVLLFSVGSHLCMAPVPRKKHGTSFFVSSVVQVQEAFVLDKNSPCGSYEVEPIQRFSILAECCFGIPGIFGISSALDKIHELCFLMKDVGISNFGFDKSRVTSAFLRTYLAE